MHLNELRKYDSVAFQRYVDMLVEDCQDTFVVYEGGKIAVGTVEGRIMTWNPKSTAADVGAGWEKSTHLPNVPEEPLGLKSVIR